MAAKAEMLEEYLALKKRREEGGVTAEEDQRIDLLEDVLLELGALGERNGDNLRPMRSAAVLQVDVQTPERAARAYSKNIGTGGIAITTTEPLAVGAVLELRMAWPDGKPLVTQAKVMWSEGGTVGLGFTGMTANDERRVRQAVLSDDSVVSRIRNVLTTDVKTAFTTDVRELGQRKLEPLPSSAVDLRPVVAIRLGNPALTEAVSKLLETRGLRVAAPVAGLTPKAIVVDSATALDTLSALSRPPGMPIVLVNVSGPDAVMGRLATVPIAAFVRPPATAEAVANTLTQLLARRG